MGVSYKIFIDYVDFVIKRGAEITCEGEGGAVLTSDFGRYAPPGQFVEIYKKSGSFGQYNSYPFNLSQS